MSSCIHPQARTTPKIRQEIKDSGLSSPIKISKILTDNGLQFTDRFTTKDKKPSGKHAFDVACVALPAEHRLAPPRHPQTDGMVERFNGAATSCSSRPVSTAGPTCKPH